MTRSSLRVHALEHTSLLEARRDHEAFRRLLAPWRDDVVPTRRVPGDDPLDRALARLEGLEIDALATRARWIAALQLGRGVPRGRSGPTRTTANRRTDWGARAFATLAVRDASGAVGAVGGDGRLRDRPARSWISRAVRRLGTTGSGVDGMGELARVALEADPSVDSYVLAAVVAWLRRDGAAVDERLDRADRVGAPAHDPVTALRWRAVLRALRRETVGDLRGAGIALDETHPADRERPDHALVRLALAACAGDAVTCGAEVEAWLATPASDPGASASRGRIAALVVPRLRRWRRLRPGPLAPAVRRRLGALLADGGGPGRIVAGRLLEVRR